MSIVAAHEYWRILSGGFVHNGVVHFVISLYALYATGKLCEQRLGRGWYMAVFLSSVILGNAAQLIAAPNGIATGMSAGDLWCGGSLSHQSAAVAYTATSTTAYSAV